MKKLYTFKKLTNYLDKHNFPKAKSTKIEIIRADLTQKQNEGKIEFREDGVYLLHNNVWQQGYMYIKNADVAQFGLPKFHIFECFTIKNQKDRGWFHNHYFWSNEKLVDVLQKNSNILYQQVILGLCGNCKKEIQAKINYETTEGFFELLNIQNEIQDFSTVEVDIFGYTKDWRQISQKFRIKNNYICNACKLDLSNYYDKRNLEVHHKDSEKRNNNEDNLECRCLYCHTIADEHHIRKFKEDEDRQIRMKHFITKYGMHLSKHYKLKSLQII